MVEVSLWLSSEPTRKGCAGRGTEFCCFGISKTTGLSILELWSNNLQDFAATIHMELLRAQSKLSAVRKGCACSRKELVLRHRNKIPETKGHFYEEPEPEIYLRFLGQDLDVC